MILFVLIFVILFLLSGLLLLYSILSHCNKQPLTAKRLLFSVVVAAKNEEKNISNLFDALYSQNYPPELLEIIFVDDGSADNTYALAFELSQGRQNIQVIKAAYKELPGKKGALEAGIIAASNPYILITDADCTPEKDWVQSFAEKFISGYDILFGRAPFRPDKNPVNRIACFEELRSSILTFGLAGLGFPYSAAARSLGFTREAYNKIDGYEYTTETLSGDDDLLIREAVKKKLRIGTVLSDNANVFSGTKSTFRDYLFQKARHTSTSNYYLLRHQFILAFWHLMNLGFLFSPVLTGISGLFWLPFITKLSIDFITVQTLQKRFSYKFRKSEIIPLQINYELLLIVNYFLSFSRKNKW